MVTLFPLLPFVADETPMSWAARQAAFHTGGRVIPFLNDLGIPVADLNRGRYDAVLSLCEKAGVDPTPVLHNSISAIGERRFKLRRLEFAAEFTTGLETRYCPRCLQDDCEGDGLPKAQMRHRLIWCLAPVRTCGIHNMALQVHRSGKWDDIVRDVTSMPMEDVEGQGTSWGKAASRDVSPLQAYVEARLDGVAGPDWMDGQAIDQAVRAADMLGGLALFGPTQKTSNMTSDMWDAAGRAAWPIVSRGEAGIREFLTDYAADHAKSASGSHLAGTYGMLFRWLGASRLSKHPGPIHGILRDVITETTPLSIGQKVLGEPEFNPRFCTVASLAKSSVMHTQTLMNVLQVSGALGEAAEDTAVVPYREIADLVEAAKNAMPVTHVPTFLNVSRPMVAALIDLGVLTRIQDHNVLRSKIGKAIDGRSIQALLQKIKQTFPEVDDVPDTHVALAKAAEKTHVQLKAILELLFAGHLKSALRFKGEHRLGAVVVDPDEIRKVIASPPPGCPDVEVFAM